MIRSFRSTLFTVNASGRTFVSRAAGAIAFVSMPSAGPTSKSNVVPQFGHAMVPVIPCLTARGHYGRIPASGGDFARNVAPPRRQTCHPHGGRTGSLRRHGHAPDLLLCVRREE